MAGSTGETPRDRQTRRAERGTAVTRRVAAALTVALLVSVPALGCAGSEESTAPSEAAADATGSADTGASTVGQRLQEVKTQLCGELSDLDADLTEVSTSGTEAGQDVLDRIGSFATTFESGAASLTAVGADDAAAAAEELAANLESLSTSGGEDARALAGDGAERAQELSDALQCP